IDSKGIALHLGTRPRDIQLAADGSTVMGVRLNNGQRLEADLVVFAIGIRPRDELAAEAGLELGPRGGVVIGTDCRSSAP
ncbi:FAD-dependent oxidoreductase, partial [Acinetobacter baumannii]